jgi:hypothetical protein
MPVGAKKEPTCRIIRSMAVNIEVPDIKQVQITENTLTVALDNGRTLPVPPMNF